MAIITNYPNVPIITTNVATDSVRNDNEHKSSVAPTAKVTKPHEERAIDPEKEHDAHQQHNQQQQKHHDDTEDEVLLSETSDSKQLKAKEMLAIKHAALSRTDIKIQTDDNQPMPEEPSQTPQTKNVPNSEDVKQVRKNINSAYHTNESKPKSNVNEWG